MAKGIILGAGITGLSAGISTGLPVYERSGVVGGICRSYRYDVNGLKTTGTNGFRFENGGGHWIFGASQKVEKFLRQFGPLNRYSRNSGVVLPQADGIEIIPFPLQENIWALKSLPRRRRWVGDLIDANESYVPRSSDSLDEWLFGRFGDGMYREFFKPFNTKYTGGLIARIAPQDPYKNPVDFKRSVLSAFEKPSGETGYNSTFLYPPKGLDSLCDDMAGRCDEVYINKEVEFIDLNGRHVVFNVGPSVPYDFVISTLPLTTMIKLTGLKIHSDNKGRITQPPSTQVVVVNIGGTKGNSLPDGHWYYFPDQFIPFHRVGVYSNVDSLFVPNGDTDKYVSFYVEAAPVGGATEEYVKNLKLCALEELKRMEWLKEELVVKVDVIEPAYTWDYPMNNWVSTAKQRLENFGVHQLGRYANWKFQGIAESIEEGFSAKMIAESYR